ncbi:uncharacterized protein LOC133778209 [Humulus lupulus]|uniref:uncharacterized protein LOC133778209 n=1 Tax=Humulus lupulus TaxID=3486 RepID=UPI002B40D4EC|nr:uncharacterized protein LOC133778209 [Humulus lupulus]
MKKKELQSFDKKQTSQLGVRVLSSFSMVRRKKVHPKPTTIDKGKIKPGSEKEGEGSIAVDDEVPSTELEEIFKDSMAEFPEFGGSIRRDRNMDGDEIQDSGLKWSEQDDGDNDFMTRAKDKWSSFKNLLPNQGGARLKFAEPLVQDGHRIAQVDLEEIAVEASIWNSAVVCMVLGANPPFAIFEGFIKKMWGNLGIEKIARLNVGHTLVKFRDEVTKDLVLENGVLHFDRKPVIVRPWTTELDHLRLVKSVPVWVRLPGLGLQYWGTKCLSALVSTLRRPILVDKVTKDRSMMKFARVLVEIDITDEVPKSIQFMNERGQLMEQLAEFEWLLTQCKNCKVYGHIVSLCNRKKEEIWKPKDQKAGGADGILESPKAHLQSTNVEGVTTHISKTDQEKENQSSSNINVDHEDVWVTPKRVGGVKKLAHKGQNKLKNTYDVLQDKRLEGLKMDDNSVGLGSFLETKLRGEKVEDMMRNYFNGWSFYKGSVNEGRILLVWKSNMLVVDIIQESDQFIHTLIKEFPAAAWLLTGDFNSVFDGDDRLGGRSVTTVEMNDAQSWKALGMADELRSIGSHFTWTNNQAGRARIYSKIYRIFKNEEWIDLFPESVAVIRWDIFSDHCYYLIKTLQEVVSGFKPFRFFNMWIEHAKFKNTVMDCWNKLVNALGLDKVMVQLKRLSRVLRQFNKHEIGDVECNFQAAKERYNRAQTQCQQAPHIDVFQIEEQTTFNMLVQQYRVYDSYLRQRSKVNWLRFGDDNTTYFHACLKQWKEINRITSFVTETGQLVENYEEVVDHFILHFRNALGSHSKTLGSIQNDCFIHGNILSLEHQLALIKPFSRKDVKSAMFSIGSIKSPGPDGYGSGFFKAMWNEIGDDISDAILGFFQQGSLPKGLNNALLTLIPKVPNPTKAVEYRPIACCNALYKCISKMICGRLNLILPVLINQNQGAFFRDRLLAHNILIFQDILKEFRVVLLGGRGLDKGTRFPLCCLCIMEYFTRFLIQATQNKDFKFHPRCKKLSLVSLCFADDLVLFCKGNNTSVQVIQACFKSFSAVSGLTANLEKSRVYFGGLSEKETRDILKELQYAEDTLSFAGKAQLIHFVLLGIRAFWMSIFLLPKKVIAKIDHLCRKFLWGTNRRNDHRSKLHLTAWDQVCLPKQLGGVGFKEGVKWNMVLLAKYIWAVSSKQDVLWVKWIDAIYLKGQSIWDYKLQADVSWYWRKLIKLTTVIKSEILIKATVRNKLNTSKLYGLLVHKDRVHYDHVVWCNLTLPKHRFILWQGTLRHLLTRDNLLKCHLQLPSDLCPTCELQQECHEHLFFQCQFSQMVRHRVAAWLNCDVWPVQYQGWIEWMKGKPKGIQQKILAAGLAAAVYLIWWNRNHCLYNLCSLSVNSVVSLLQKSLFARIKNLPRSKLTSKDVIFLERINLL